MNIALTLITVIASFGITAVSGTVIIPFLHKLKFGQTIREIGPSWHKHKQGTPTMGGMMFILGIVIAVILSMVLSSVFAVNQTDLLKTKLYAGLCMSLGFGLIGFLDDYISVVKKRNLGLKEGQKLILQFLVAGSYFFSCHLSGDDTATIIPFVGKVDFGIFYYILSILIIVGIVNAVNFTDGIDGLNSTVCFFSFIGLTVCASILSIPGISLFGYAAAAGCLGFLVWNFHPAKVIMGDTGSLFLGGVLCALAFGIDMPVLLLPAGIICIIEIVSVVMQTTYFKATHGKRIFKMAPIHHHFEMMGWSEVKICVVFGAVSLIGAIVSIVLVCFGV